jgi:hypothetical protein
MNSQSTLKWETMAFCHSWLAYEIANQTQNGKSWQFHPVKYPGNS